MSDATKSVAIARPALHHTTLKTTRLQEMIAWYGTVVGMTVNHQFPDGAGSPTTGRTIASRSSARRCWSMIPTS